MDEDAISWMENAPYNFVRTEFPTEAMEKSETVSVWHTANILKVKKEEDLSNDWKNLFSLKKNILFFSQTTDALVLFIVGSGLVQPPVWARAVAVYEKC